MSFAPKSADTSLLQDAESAVNTSTELARQTVSRTRAGLDELEARTVAPVGNAAETFAQVARQLSDMVVATATEITRSGPAGRAFMPLVEQLANAARTTLTAVHELRRTALDGRARVRQLGALTNEAQAALDRVGPALDMLTTAAAQGARTHAPAVEVVVRTGAFATDRAARVAQLTEEVLNLKTPRPSGPKN